MLGQVQVLDETLQRVVEPRVCPVDRDGQQCIRHDLSRPSESPDQNVLAFGRISATDLDN